MKRIFFFTLWMVLLLPLGIKAGEDWHAEAPAWTVVESKADATLKNTESVFDLHFRLPTGAHIKAPIKLSYNGKEKTVTPDANGLYALKVKPGKYIFQFWYNKQYHEITTDSIDIKPAHRTNMQVHFRSATVNTHCRKPVIYLYPTQTTDVNVKVDLFGDFTFTYPAYDTINGWQVTAQPDGTLQQGSKQYSYLFWEGITGIRLHPFIKHGFVVNKTELTAFFEEKLAHIGLTSSEIQDFITYWVPALQQHDRYRLYFMLNDEYNRYVKLTVTPRPDQLIRIMMLWEPLEKNADTSDIGVQVLPHYERKGFTLVEWGGAEIQYLLKCKF